MEDPKKGGEVLREWKQTGDILCVKISPFTEREKKGRLGRHPIKKVREKTYVFLGCNIEIGSEVKTRDQNI